MDEATSAQIERLREFPILGGLDETVLAQLAHVAHEEQYNEDEVVFDEGAEGDSLFFVLEGAVVVQRSLDAQHSQFKDVAYCEQGDIFGEMALFDHKPRSARVRSTRPLRVLRIFRRDFERFLNHDSARASAILGGLLSMQNARLREAGQNNVIMFRLVNIIASTNNMRELAHQVIEGLRTALQHIFAAVFCAWNEFVDECEVLDSHGIDPSHLSTFSITRDGPMAATLSRSHEPYLMHSVHPAHPLHDALGLRPRDTVLIAPLLMRGELHGYILLARRGMDFTSQHRLLVASVASPVASALVNLRWVDDERARNRLQRARLHPR